MSCTNTLIGLGTSCKNELGGISEAYFIDFESVESVTTTGGSITALTLASGEKFKTYKFDENVSNWSSTRSVNNGIGVYNAVINLQFKTLEAAKNVEVSALAEGHLAGIIKNRSGRYFFFGKDGYLTSNDSASAETGTNYDDFNGYNLVLNGQSAYFPFEIPKELFEANKSTWIEDAPATA